ncbi:MAG: AsmA-like C-terminal region-containing protein [Bacteroidota bacterium]|nr:AsmA-like C-terminal region-containing protein [Bacteroidota bacterium]
MVSSKIKLWTIVLLIPVGLMVGLVVFLKIYFSSDRLKNFVIPKIEDATQRSIEISDISLSLFPTFGIEIDNLKISNPKDLKFEKEEFVSLEQLLLDVQIFPLFKNRLEVNEVIIKRPTLYIETNEAGITNYGSSKEGTDTLKSADVKVEVKGFHGASILLSNLQIIDGKLDYINKKDDNRVTITGYNQKTRAESLTGEEVGVTNEIKIEKFSFGTVKSNLVENLPIRSYQQLTYLSEKDELRFDSVNVGINEIQFFGKGVITNTQTTPIVDFEIYSKNTELKQLLSIVPKEFLKAAEGISSTGKFSFLMTVKGEVSDTIQPSVAGKFLLENGTVKYTQLPKSITDINVDGNFERSQKIRKLNVEKFSLKLGANTVSGKLNVVDFDNPVISSNINGVLNLSEIKDFYPLEKGTELAGLIRSNISLNGKVKLPTSIKAEGKMEFQNVAIATAVSANPIKNLNGTININNQIIESKQLDMDIGNSDMKIAFTLKNYLAMMMEKAEAGKPSALITLNSKQFFTADIMGTEQKEVERAAGKKAEPILFPNIDINANVSIGKLVMEKFDFTDVRGSLSIVDGVVNLQGLSLNAFAGSIITKGTIDMRKHDGKPFNLQLDIAGVEGNTLLSNFTSFGKNIFGKLTMNTTIKGQLDDTLGLTPQTLSGEGKVQIFDGKLTGYPVMQKIAEFTGLDELRQIDFKNWSNNFDISDGRINLQDLKISALNSDISMKGYQAFDGSLAYDIGLKLPAALSEKLKVGGTVNQLVNVFKDKDGRFLLPLLVGGSLTKPVVSLNTKEQKRQLEDAARQEIEKRKDELKEKIGEEVKKLEDTLKQKGIEELKKKGEDAIKKLFRKP